LNKNANLFKNSFTRFWKRNWKCLDIGHRGSGTSFKETSGESIRENTIASMKKAGSGGADFVEFDVQLSKDLIPVIYHDFNVCVSLKKKVSTDAHDMLELPMRKLTLEQLKKLKVYHTSEGLKREAKFFDEDLVEHQPFPELSEVLDTIDENLGFNVEVKWAQKLESGKFEGDHKSIDKNLYVDCILNVVLKKAGKRKIIFSCFDADICVMLRNKQNMFPVMFLTLGRSDRYPKYYNP
jgi:glycerophosphocholine phosphodiesterase GPCPD1